VIRPSIFLVKNEHLTPEYRLAWEEKVICPFPPLRGYIFWGSEGVSFACMALWKIRDMETLPLFEEAFGISVKWQEKHQGSDIWQGILKDLGSWTTIQGLKTFMRCWNKLPNEKLKQTWIQAVGCISGWDPIIEAELKKAKAGSEYEKFLLEAKAARERNEKELEALRQEIIEEEKMNK
jgi:hypothetical protein